MIELYLELVVRPFAQKLLADPTIGKDKRSTLLLIVDGGDGKLRCTSHLVEDDSWQDIISD